MPRYNVSFDGELMPRFMSVVKVDNSILPEISQNTISVPGRVGSFCFGSEIGTRQIDIEVIIFADKQNQLPKYAREVARWLMHDRPKKLELGDNPGYYYYATFTGGSALEELSKIGRATLSFMCYDPLLYGGEITTYHERGGSFSIKNLGTAPTFPIISMKANKRMTGFSVVGRNEFVEVGKGLGVQDRPVDKDPYVLDEHFVSLNRWTQAPGMAGDGVSIDLEKPAWEIYEGTSIRINESSWKENGSEWHGGGLESDWGTPAQDFEFVAPVYFDGTLARSRGMIQTNIKDSSNRILASVQYKRSSIDMQSLRIEVILYNSRGQGTVAVSTGLFGADAKFIGAARIRRVGRRWNVAIERRYSGSINDEAQAGEWKDKTGLRQIDSRTFTDGDGSYSNPIKKAQVGMFMWGDYEKGKPKTEHEEEVLAMLRSPMLIYNVFVKNLNHNEVSSGVSETIIYPGDRIVINCEEGAVYKNGQYFMNHLAPKSTFIKLDNYFNGLRIDPADGFSEIVVTTTPKWY